MCRAVFFAIFVSTSVYAAPPAEVPFGDLVKHPRKYNGKHVSVRAYIVTSCVHCGELWESVAAAKKFGDRKAKVQQCIAIGGFAPQLKLTPSFSDSVRHQRYDGYVYVTGRFKYIRITSKILGRQPQPDGTERVIAQGTQAFGWGGIDDKVITDITELWPIGAPIPAQEKWFMPRDASNQSVELTATRYASTLLMTRTSSLRGLPVAGGGSSLLSR
jgi:hypothetical protein